MNVRVSRHCRASYDAVAEEYVRRIFDELQHKPLDQQLLDRFAERVRNFGPVCDMGCGPGHVARYLHERGVAMCGIDLSPVMVERARELTPGIEFRQGDMRSLTVPDETWAGIVAFYSLIHIEPASLTMVVQELSRVLRSDGDLLIAFHVGDQTVHLEEWWGHAVNVDFHFFRPDAIANILRSAGFEIVEQTEREPYPEIEHQSRRCYVLARKPS